MVSAVSGENSERGVFIPLLSKHFLEAKDDADVDRIFKQTRRSMKKEQAEEKKPDQTPIYMHTLDSDLVLKQVFKPS